RLYRLNDRKLARLAAEHFNLIRKLASLGPRARNKHAHAEQRLILIPFQLIALQHNLADHNNGWRLEVRLSNDCLNRFQRSYNGALLDSRSPANERYRRLRRLAV